MITQQINDDFSTYLNNIDTTLKAKGINNFIEVFVKSLTVGEQVTDGFIDHISYIDIADKLYNFLVKG